MNKVTLFTLALALVFCAHCGLNFRGKPSVSTKSDVLQTEPYVAATAKHYAYSAMVVNGVTRKPISQFSIDLIGTHESINTVINPLGNQDGVFHVSRLVSYKQPGQIQVPILVSAAGYEPVVGRATISTDCRGTDCLEPLIQPILLKPADPNAGLNPDLYPPHFSPNLIDAKMNATGTLEIFQQLVKQGKLSPELQKLLSSANNGDVLSNIVVLLDGVTGDTELIELISYLLGSVQAGSGLDGLLGGFLGGGAMANLISTLVPILAASSPEIAAALVAINLALPYIKPIVDQLAQNFNGPIVKLLQAFLSGTDPQGNIISLIGGVSGSGKPNLQKAMAGFLPILQKFSSWNKKKGNSLLAPSPTPQPFSGLLLGFLSKQGGLLGFLKQGLDNGSSKPPFEKNPLLSKVAPYIQPLLQGLISKEAPEIAALLNKLLAGQNPLDAIKNFSELLGKDNELAKILPYLEPIIQGLKGQDANLIASFLEPFLNQANPGQALQKLITDPSGDFSQYADLIQAIFPSMGSVLRDGTSSKQLFVSQLLNGLLKGNFIDLTVLQDLPGSSALVLSGQARDIFKIAQLPNVRQLIVVPKQ